MPFSKGQPGRIMKDFCESTSLHGYNYLYIAENIVLKLIWLLVIIGMTGIGTVFIVINTNTYIKARLVTNIESSTANLDVRITFSFYQFKKCAILTEYVYVLGSCVSICDNLQFKSVGGFFYERVECTWKHYNHQSCNQ